MDEPITAADRLRQSVNHDAGVVSLSAITGFLDARIAQATDAIVRQGLTERESDVLRGKISAFRELRGYFTTTTETP